MAGKYLCNTIRMIILVCLCYSHQSFTIAPNPTITSPFFPSSASWTPATLDARNREICKLAVLVLPSKIRGGTGLSHLRLTLTLTGRLYCLMDACSISASASGGMCELCRYGRRNDVGDWSLGSRVVVWCTYLNSYPGRNEAPNWA